VTTYVDSSALVAVYVTEAFSHEARAVVRAAGQVPFTAIHRLEVPNAFEMLVGRELITWEQCRAVNSQLHEDIDDQRVVTVPLDLDRVFADASELSRLYTARLLARSLDLLHVAAARVIECQRFVSADDRQLAVAKAMGLKTVDIKRRARTKKS
jgi:predicted nucleic acid-binding protein